MIKYICDLCGKETTALHTMVLHKKSFEYCDSCKKRAEEIKKDFKDEIKQEYLTFEFNLKETEKNFYRNKIAIRSVKE